MIEITYEQGDTVIKEGDKGDSFYLIEQGEAEVLRSDPFTDEVSVVDTMSAGDSFREESLIQQGFRNATIKNVNSGCTT